MRQPLAHASSPLTIDLRRGSIPSSGGVAFETPGLDDEAALIERFLFNHAPYTTKLETLLTSPSLPLVLKAA